MVNTRILEPANRGFSEIDMLIQGSMNIADPLRSHGRVTFGWDPYVCCCAGSGLSIRTQSPVIHALRTPTTYDLVFRSSTACSRIVLEQGLGHHPSPVTRSGVITPLVMKDRLPEPVQLEWSANGHVAVTSPTPMRVGVPYHLSYETLDKSTLRFVPRLIVAICDALRRGKFLPFSDQTEVRRIILSGVSQAGRLINEIFTEQHQVHEALTDQVDGVFLYGAGWSGLNLERARSPGDAELLRAISLPSKEIPPFLSVTTATEVWAGPNRVPVSWETGLGSSWYVASSHHGGVTRCHSKVQY